MKPATREWVEKAEGDWTIVRREWKSRKPVYDAVCFHLQQCVEKYLKALLEEYGHYVAKTHSVAVLIEKCEPQLVIPDEMKKELKGLTFYAVSYRYPGESANRQETKEATEIVKRFRRFIREYLQISGRRLI